MLATDDADMLRLLKTWQDLFPDCPQGMAYVGKVLRGLLNQPEHTAEAILGKLTELRKETSSMCDVWLLTKKMENKDGISIEQWSGRNST